MFPRRPLSTWQVQPALSRRVLAGIFAPGGTVCGSKATIIAAEVSVAAVAVEDHAAPGDSFSGHNPPSISFFALNLAKNQASSALSLKILLQGFSIPPQRSPGPFPNHTKNHLILAPHGSSTFPTLWDLIGKDSRIDGGVFPDESQTHT